MSNTTVVQYNEKYSAGHVTSICLPLWCDLLCVKLKTVSIRLWQESSSYVSEHNINALYSSVQFCCAPSSSKRCYKHLLWFPFFSLQKQNMRRKLVVVRIIGTLSRYGQRRLKIKGMRCYISYWHYWDAPAPARCLQIYRSMADAVRWPMLACNSQ